MINNPIWIVDQTHSSTFKQLIESFVKLHHLIPENLDEDNFSALKTTDHLGQNSWINYHSFKNLGSYSFELIDHAVIKKITDQFFSNGHDFSFRSDIVAQSNNVSPTDPRNKVNLNFDVHFVLDTETSSSDIFKSIVELEKQYIKTNIWTSQTRFYIHVLIPLLSNQSTPKDCNLLPELNRFVDNKLIGNNLLGGVFLYQTDTNKDYKDDVFTEVLLSIATISGGEQRFIDELHRQFTNSNPSPIYQTAASGVFLEDKVYKEKQAYILTQLIRKTLNEDEGVYLNSEEASDKALKINLEKLDGNQLVLKSQKKLFAELRNKIINEHAHGWKKYWNQPKNQLKLYFKGFLAKLKFNLINQVSGVLEDEYKAYEKKALKHKEINIQSISKNLDEEIFKVLDNKPYNTLNQCYAVSEKLCDRVKKEYIGKKVDGLNKIFENDGPSLEQFDADKIVDEKNRLLREISTLVKDHPIIFWAALSRVSIVTLLLCVLSNYLGAPIVAIFNLGLENYPWIPGLLISVIPIFLVFRNQYKRIKNIHELIDKYISLSIEELNQRAEELNKRHIQETRSAVLAYLEWVKDDKIKKQLIDGIKDANFEPKEYAFTVKSKVNVPALQPIYDLPIDSNKTGEFALPQSKSADFSVARDKPILKKELLDKMSPVIEISNQNVTFSELFNDNSSLIDILPEYYKFEVEVDKVYQDAAIVKEEPKRYLLVLDVSGSMAEEINFKNTRKSKYEALKTTLNELGTDTSGLELQYIAFSTDAEIVKDISNLPKPNGVTNLPAAFNLINNKVSEFDKVILVSDGQPTNSSGEVLPDNDKLDLQKIAFGLGKPLDVIYIGETQDDGVDFMQRLAAITGGNYFAENIDRLKNCIEERFKIFYQVADKKQKLPIRKLLESGNKEACIFGLFAYCISKVENTSIALDKCLEEMLKSNDFQGYKTFINYSADFSDLKSGATHIDFSLFNTSSIRDNIVLKIKEQLDAGLSIQFLKFINEYKFMHSIIGLRQIKQISDLQLNSDWGITFETQNNN